MNNHPGGRFSFENNIGRDITKFFYGGDSMESLDHLKPFAHSNIARNIINTLIIGKLESEAETFIAQIISSKMRNANTYSIQF